MTGPTHLLIGITSGIGLSYATGIIPSPIHFLFLLIGSVAPDIDGNGTITRPGKVLNKLIPYSAAQVIDGIFITISKILNLLFGHRGFLHWPILPMGMILFSMAFHKVILFWFFWGYFSHIIGDYITTEGIPMLAPISKKRFSLSEIKTGSTAEIFIAIILCFIIIIYGPHLLPEDTKEALFNLIEQTRNIAER